MGEEGDCNETAVGTIVYTFEGSTAGSTRDAREEVEAINVTDGELSCGIEYSVAEEFEAWAGRETVLVGGSHSEVLSEAADMRVEECGD